jgi:hypothetical protein
VYAARSLAHADGVVREKALRTLRRSIAGVEPIIAVRAARVLWIADRRMDDVRGPSERGLQDPAKWNRVETLSAILDMGRDAKPFIPAIEPLLTDPDRDVRDRAERTLDALRRR